MLKIDNLSEEKKKKPPNENNGRCEEQKSLDNILIHVY